MTLTFKQAIWYMHVTGVLPFNFETHHTRQIYELDTTDFHCSLLWSMILEPATRFLFAIHPLVMVIICATLFINPTIHEKKIWVKHEKVSLKPMHKV